MVKNSTLAPRPTKPSHRCWLSSQLCPLVLLLLGLSSLAQAQLSLPPVVTETLERPAEEVGRIRRELEQEADEALDKRLSSSLPDGLPPELALPDEPLGALPDTLPVLDAQGATAFLDVEVEGGWRAVQRQWLLILAPGELAGLEQLDVEILEQTRLSELGLNMVRFRVPRALDSRTALQEALPVGMADRLDRNHIYSPQAGTIQPSVPASPPPEPLCRQTLKIGMVDTAIATDHPGFARARILERKFLPQGLSADGTSGQPLAHGTAVAGLLVGTLDAYPPRLAGARLYNASVFYSRNQYAQGATMMHLVKGLNWLVEEGVSVINMSLTGPDNRILAATIERIAAGGGILVAAAGNEGPAAQALYPAAYSTVVAATAVDSRQEIYRWANRGEHIDFAAPGVSVLTARSGGDFGRQSGTSMAAPVVTAHVACALATQPGTRHGVVQRLAGQAEDLGEPGRDPVYGYGLLH